MNTDRLWRWMMLGVLGAIGAGVWTGLGSPAMARNSMSGMPTPVAVVDIAEVLDNLDEKAQREGELKRIIEERKASVDRMTQQIGTLTEDLKLLPDGAEAKSKREQLVRLQASRKIEAEIAAALVENERQTMQVALVRKIIEATRKVAQRDGWQIVVTDDRHAADTGDGQDFNITQQLQLLAQRNLIFAAEPVEITTEVTRLMNNEFKAGQ